MADQSTQSIVVEAPPAAIMAVIADFPNYPSWAGSVKKAEVVEDGPDGRARRVAFVLDAGVVRDQYELVYDWDGDRRVEWELVKGQMMRAQRGS
ncbi:MAG TPA: SRPBCC family protein, partial [Jatrophihabitantaceae bacterium]